MNEEYLTAKQARELSSDSLAHVLNRVKDAALNGFTSIECDNITPDIERALKSLGYDFTPKFTGSGTLSW